MNTKYLSSPKLFCLSITDECNLRCKQCDMWKHKNPERELSTKEKINILDKIKEWVDSNITVAFTGGEPYLKPSEMRWENPVFIAVKIK